MMSETKITPIELPVLDISQPLSPSALSSLSLACKEWVFSYISNHLYTKLHSLPNHLVNLPSESKLKFGPSSSAKSYTPPFIASPLFDSFRVSGPDFFASGQTTAKVFNEQSSDFSETLKEYGNKKSALSKAIIKVVIMSLGEDFQKKFYESESINCHGYFRINNYSPRKRGRRRS